MLRIQRSVKGKCVVFVLSGRIEAQHLPELQALFATEDVGIKLELSEVNLVDREVVRFLGKCEAGGVRLDHCPAYIREWILREQCDE